MNNKQLALEIQKSSDMRMVAQSQATLMPKRIMSAKRQPSVKKEVVKRVPKDRSALIGVKRTRKSRDQICELQKMYEDSRGKPSKAQLRKLAEDTGLKLQQVYKWYWDTEKKNDKLQKEIKETDPEVQSPMRLSRKILKTQYTDEFGGYSKTWFSDGLKEMRNQTLNQDENILGDDNEETKMAGNGGDYGMDFLARSLGLDINALAIKLAQDDTTAAVPAQEIIVSHAIEASNPNTPTGPMKADEVRKGVLIKGKGSPIINPIVLRPCNYNSPIASHASASNVSIVRQEAVCQNGSQQNRTNFSNDKIHEAFQNLFGSTGTPAFM